MRSRVLTMLVLSIAVLQVVACGDRERSITAPGVGAPLALISDGSRAGGNPDFFFLPPLVPEPSGDSDYEPAEFNAGWKPVVQVCRLGDNLEAGCTSGVLRTWQGAEVQVSAADQQYQAQIDTRESWALEGNYRVSVYLPGKTPKRLGFVDLALLPSQQAVRNARTNDLVALQDGRTLPLKFRIENGASVSPNSHDYAEQVVTNAGGIVRTTDQGTGLPGGAAIQFSPGWLGDQATEVVVSISKVPAGETDHCSTTIPYLLQTSDCWRVTTSPAIATVQAEVVVAFCPAVLPGQPNYVAQAMYKYDATPAPHLRELPSVSTTLVSCAGTLGLATPRPRGFFAKLQRDVARAARGVGRVFAPATAYAIDAGWGGRLATGDEAFSDFVYGMPLTLQLLDGDGQATTPGGALAQPLRVRVLSAHQLAENGDTVPVTGVPVALVDDEAGNTFSATGTMTDANGIAAFSWTAVATPGQSTARVRVTSPTPDTSVVFHTLAAPTLSITVTDDGDVVTANTLSMVAGSSNTLLATSTPTALPCSWTSGDPSVAAVSPTGGITAIAAGTTTLTVACGTASTTYYSPYVTRTFTVTVSPPPTGVVSTIDLARASGAPYTYDFVNALVGTGNLLVAVPRDASGNAISAPCTWSDLGSAAVDVYPSTQTPNAADIVGVSPTGSSMQQVQVDCGNVSRQLFASVALTNSIGNVDSLEVFVAYTAAAVPLGAQAILPQNSQLALVARPLDILPQFQDLSSTVACGWYQANGALTFSPMTGNNVTVTTTTGASKMWVTCQGYTREFSITLQPTQ